MSHPNCTVVKQKYSGIEQWIIEKEMKSVTFTAF